jgi:hypothetical protein
VPRPAVTYQRRTVEPLRCTDRFGRGFGRDLCRGVVLDEFY